MSETNTLIETVARALQEDPDIPQVKKDQLLTRIRSESPPLQSDRWIYRVVVGSLGLAVLLTITFSFVLYYRVADGSAPKIPDLFLAMGSAALGALAGLLAPSPTGKN